MDIAPDYLERTLEESPAGPFFLRRMIHMAIMADREITQAELARELGVSKELVGIYFKGKLYTHPDHPEEFKSEGCRCDRISRHTRYLNSVAKQQLSSEEGEDRIELALEAISRRKGFTVQPVVEVTGPVDETGLPDFRFPSNYVGDTITKSLMSQDPGMLRRPKGAPR